MRVVTRAVALVGIVSLCLFGVCGIASAKNNQGSFGFPTPSSTATATLDDDGNAAFAFSGSSCAAGPSTVIADILAGIHSTDTVVAPVPTI